MNYAGVIYADFANGPGIRTSLFVSGCNAHCLGCFNQEQQDFCYGKPYTFDTTDKITANVNKSWCAGLSILGGDAMWQNNDGITMLVDLCQKVHRLGKTVWLWTGFTWRELIEDKDASQLHLLYNCDVMVDGAYKQLLKASNLLWRGSANQRIIDVQRTLDADKIILYKDGEYT